MAFASDLIKSPLCNRCREGSSFFLCPGFFLRFQRSSGKSGIHLKCPVFGCGALFEQPVPNYDSPSAPGADSGRDGYGAWRRIRPGSAAGKGIVVSRNGALCGSPTHRPPSPVGSRKGACRGGGVPRRNGPMRGLRTGPDASGIHSAGPSPCPASRKTKGSAVSNCAATLPEKLRESRSVRRRTGAPGVKSTSESSTQNVSGQSVDSK